MGAHLIEKIPAGQSAARIGMDIDLLLSRAELLGESDRKLIEAVYQRQVPASDLAKLMGQPTRRLQYRVRNLVQHLRSRRFVKAMRALPYLSPRQREVVLRHLLRRVSLRRTADELNLTVHRVRALLGEARGVMQACQRARDN